MEKGPNIAGPETAQGRAQCTAPSAGTPIALVSERTIDILFNWDNDAALHVDW